MAVLEIARERSVVVLACERMSKSVFVYGAGSDGRWRLFESIAIVPIVMDCSFEHWLGISLQRAEMVFCMCEGWRLR